MSLIMNTVLGALVGIIINYLADVLPISRRFSRPICLNCGKPFPLRDYLISFKCKSCGNKTPARVILVLLFSIFSAILLKFFPFKDLSLPATLPIVIFLGTILVIDIEYRVVLKETSYFGLALCLVYGIVIRGFLSTIAGGLAGFLSMLLLYYLGVLFNKVMGRIRKQEIEEVALGFGDVFASAFLGFLTGWPNIIAVLLLAIFASGIFSLFYIVIMSLMRKYHAFSAVPYTPFLIIAAVAMSYLA